MNADEPLTDSAKYLAASRRPLPKQTDVEALAVAGKALDCIYRTNRELLELDPVTVLSLIYSDRRGGLPGASIPSGSPSANRPPPQLGATDVQCVKDEREFVESAKAMLAMAQVMRKIQDRVILRIHPDKARIEAADEPGNYRFVCDACGKDFKLTAEQRPKRGMCKKCYLADQADRHAGR